MRQAQSLKHYGVVTKKLSGVLKKRGTVFIFSDFMDPSPFATALKRLSRRHETIAVQITDPLESNLPALGLIDFIDPETGELVTLDTSSPMFKRYYNREFNRYRSQVSEELKKSRVDLVEVFNGEDFVQPLANYFKKRKA